MAEQYWQIAGNSDPNLVLGTKGSNPLVIETAQTERVRIDASGNVGVGTSTPSSALHLGANRSLRIEGAQKSDSTNYFSFGGNGTFGIDAPGVPNGRFVVQDDGTVRVGNGGTLGVDLSITDQHTGQTTVTPNGAFVANAGGAVGIGMASPQFALHVASEKTVRIEGAASAGQTAAFFSMGGNGAFGIDAPGVANGRFVVEDSGNVGIGTASPASKLHVAGDITVKGDVLLDGADCAEEFDLKAGETLDGGTVVVIDASGALRPSCDPYDKKVAGVISGAGDYRPGLVLDRRPAGECRIRVALVGKVFCKADAAGAPIEVGDLLTTSRTPGHAMKATDHTSAFGAVIGKALQPLSHGRGLIPILVGLQ